MISKEILKAASQFLVKENRKNELPINHFYGLDPKPINFITSWYFDFIVERCDDKDIELISGAPGYLVYKRTKMIEVICYSDLISLTRSKTQFTSLKMASEAQNFCGFTLGLIKKSLDVPAKKLNQLKKYLDGLNLSDEESQLKLFEIIHQLESQF